MNAPARIHQRQRQPHDFICFGCMEGKDEDELRQRPDLDDEPGCLICDCGSSKLLRWEDCMEELANVVHVGISLAIQKDPDSLDLRDAQMAAWLLETWAENV